MTDAITVTLDRKAWDNEFRAIMAEFERRDLMDLYNAAEGDGESQTVTLSAPPAVVLGLITIFDNAACLDGSMFGRERVQAAKRVRDSLARQLAAMPELNAASRLTDIDDSDDDDGIDEYDQD